MPRPGRFRAHLGLGLLLGLSLALAGVAAPAAALGATATAYVANCDVNLRASASTTATVLDTIATDTTVTVTGEVSGDAWSADCVAAVSGSRWFVIKAVGGVGVSTLYGVTEVYAAVGLFHEANVLEGVDVSGWQGTIDFTQVAAAGKRFVIAKATEGIGYTAKNWARNKANAAAAGLAVTGYHFARPDLNPTDPVGEADWFVSQLGLTAGMLPPALDLEKSGGLSATGLQAWVGAWLDEVYAKTGARPMIYTSPAFWRSYLNDTTLFADEGYTVLWIAHWFVSSPTVPAKNWGGHSWTFWQYDDCGTVPGISGCVDLDRFNGLDLTRVTFGADFSLAASPPSQAVKQGVGTSLAIAIDRQFFTLPISLTVSGLPAGTSATISPSPSGGPAATLTVGTSRSGTITPVGTYPLTVTGSANGLTRTATATLVVTDGIAPTVADPVSRLFGLATMASSATPIRDRWLATDPSGIAGYALQWQVNAGPWTSLSLVSATATSLNASLAFGSTNRYRVRATDGAGNTSGWAYGPAFRPLLSQQSSSAVTYAGTWRSVANGSASGGSLRYTTAKGASATFTFNGASVSWVAYRGPNRGSAKVYVDGVYRATVNLYSSVYLARQIVFAYAWSSDGPHTLKVVSLGTAGHPRVDVDAFVRLYQL